MISGPHSLFTRTVLAAGLAASASLSADAALLNYSFNSGSATITGSIGSTSFSNATWSMSTTADTSALATGTFLSVFPIRYIATTVSLTINATGGPINVTMQGTAGLPMTAVASLDLSLVNPATIRLFFGQFAGDGSTGDGAGVIDIQPGLFPFSLTSVGSWGGSSSFNTGTYGTSGGTLSVNVASVQNDGVFTISSASAVPLPGAAALAACGLLAGGRRRRR